MAWDGTEKQEQGRHGKHPHTQANGKHTTHRVGQATYLKQESISSFPEKRISILVSKRVVNDQVKQDVKV